MATLNIALIPASGDPHTPEQVMSYPDKTDDGAFNVNFRQRPQSYQSDKSCLGTAFGFRHGRGISTSLFHAVERADTLAFDPKGVRLRA